MKLEVNRCQKIFEWGTAYSGEILRESFPEGRNCKTKQKRKSTGGEDKRGNNRSTAYWRNGVYYAFRPCNFNFKCVFNFAGDFIHYNGPSLSNVYIYARPHRFQRINFSKTMHRVDGLQILAMVVMVLGLLGQIISSKDMPSLYSFHIQQFICSLRFHFFSSRSHIQ